MGKKSGIKKWVKINGVKKSGCINAGVKKNKEKKIMVIKKKCEKKGILFKQHKMEFFIYEKMETLV